MYQRLIKVMFWVSLGLFVFFAQMSAQAQQEGETVAQYVAAAEKAQAEAETLLNALKQALVKAEAAKDTKAIKELTAAVRQAEVMVQQAQAAVEWARKASTINAARAQAQSAEQALKKIQVVIQELSPRVMQTYVAPVLPTTAPPTTVVPTTVETTTVPPTTIFTTTTSTTTTSTTTTIKPVSPSR